MSHAWHHAESSARRWGGCPADYLSLHTWFDETKSHVGSFAHRALRHHTLGIFELERVFGVTMLNSDGRTIPVRVIGEQHCREDHGGVIPTPVDWLRALRPQGWMSIGRLENEGEPVTDLSAERWRAEVARGRTTLGLKEWQSVEAGTIASAA